MDPYKIVSNSAWCVVAKRILLTFDGSISSLDWGLYHVSPEEEGARRGKAVIRHEQLMYEKIIAGAIAFIYLIPAIVEMPNLDRKEI